MKTFNHLSGLGWRIGVPVFLGFVALILLIAVSIFQLQTSVRNIGEIETRIIASEQAIADSLETFKTQVQEWKNVLLRGHDTNQRNKYWQRFQDREQDVRNRVEEVLSNNAIPESAKSNLEEFLQQHATMAEAYRAGYQIFLAKTLTTKQETTL